MKRYSVGVKVWIAVVVTVAALLTVQSLRFPGPLPLQWLAFAILSMAAAVAHIYPVRSAYDGASYRMTGAFAVAGAIVLPPGLLPLLAMLSIAPDLWVRRHSKRVFGGWLFNVAQTTVAAAAAGAWVRWAGGFRLATVPDLLSLFGAAVLFTGVQNLLVGVIAALDSRIALARTSTLTIAALLSDGLFGVLGVLMAGLWLSRPVLLLLVLPALAVAHRLTKTAHMARLAELDPKTGLYACTYFDRAAEEELIRSRRMERPFAILFADIDYLRQVNNRHGHLAGDQLLQEVAALLKANVRKGDTTARFGGEEFVSLLPATDAELAAVVAEQVRKAVADHVTVLEDGTRLRCTISIGVAAFPGDAGDVRNLIKLADMAMYRAKHTRNAVARVLPFPQEPSVKLPVASGAKGAPRPAVSRLLASAFLWATVAVGLAAVVLSLLALNAGHAWLLLVPFLPLAIASEFLTVKTYEAGTQQITLSFGIIVAMAAVAVVPAGAPIVNLVSAAVHIAAIRQKRLDKVLFNLANLPFATGVATASYVLLRPAGAGFGPWHLLAAATATTAYYLVNVGLVSVMVSLHSGRPLLRVLRESMWFGPINLILGLTGAIVGGAYVQLGIVGISMFAAPLLTLRYVLVLYAARSRQAILALKEKVFVEREETLSNVIETVGMIIDVRDNSVYGHSRQVAKYAVAIGKALELSSAELADLQNAGLLHDVGKVAIPEAVLHKPARLTADEYEVVKRHAQTGEQILSEVRQLGEVPRMVGEHHERFDGTGYPCGKSGEAISLGGRILAVADTLDSILADRPYAKGKPLERALAEIDRCAGTQFDPQVAAALHRVVATMGPGFFQAPGTGQSGAAEVSEKIS